MDQEIYGRIIKRKQFSQLCKIDVELAWQMFENRQTTLDEKIKLTRDLLRKVFSVFGSQKLLGFKNKNAEWVLKKHISTRERYGHYQELYLSLFKNFGKNTMVFDFGAGMNGFSYSFFPKSISYFGVESIGQLVDSMNSYFKENKFQNAKAIHLSLFELGKIRNLLKKGKSKKIIFLFKVIDSLEMLKKDYSKKFLKEITPLVDKVVVSFATKSLFKKVKFKANRKWFVDFIKENFHLIEDFELGDEKYLVFAKK